MPGSDPVKFLGNLQREAQQAMQACVTFSDLQAVKTQYLGPKSLLVQQLKGLRLLSPEEKAQQGKYINQVKRNLESMLDEVHRALQTREQLKKLGDTIDPSLPCCHPTIKPLHPLTQTRRRMVEIFKELGYMVAEGPELETEWFCFDALNVPPHHPARAEKDTFFFDDDTTVATTSKHAQGAYLLRTQTSTVQIRTFQKHPPPFRIVSPGRVFRRDTVDATHNFNFHQIEGLAIDKASSLVDLKATLNHFVHKFFGRSFKLRLRPSFFPFTEPSFEIDIFITNLGKLHNTWLEVCGCGMVNPQVLRNVQLDPNMWQGFAFAFGIERMAMLLYGIDDIRHFYQDDTRFLSQF